MDDRRRVRAALRSVYGTPPAESIDWWSLRRRILDAASLNGRGRARRLWDRALWRRALIPVTFAATIVMALAIAGTRTGAAAAFTPPAADSTEVSAWIRAASAGGGAVSQRELLDASSHVHSGQDAWLGAALTASSD
jgi:hypothetical protein